MEYLKKHLHIILVVIIAITAIFLRTYSFNDWILAKGDQVRDAIMVTRAFDGGPGELPLLGPRSGGTLLRLGPVFYYLQYLSTQIVGNTDLPTMAYPNLVFSLFTPLLFYYFVRMYFGKKGSLILTALLSVSFLAVEYSRFAWNPNSVPFFSLLFVYSLLKFFHDEKKMLWTVLAAISLAIVSQFHFPAFIALPIIGMLFCAIKWREVKSFVKIKHVAAFASIMVLFYLPVIFSDMLTRGDNMRQFIEAVGGKSSDHPLLKNIIKDGYFFGKYFFRILTGYFGSNAALYRLGTLFVIAGFAVGIFLFKKEKDKVSKDFLALNGIFFIVYFLLYVPLSYSIDKPRFFLPLIGTAFIFLGWLGIFSIEVAKKRFIAVSIVSIGACVLLGSNLFANLTWFSELSRSQKSAMNPKETIILKTKKDSAWWLWAQFLLASSFVKENCAGDEDIHAYFGKNVAEFSDTFEYALGASGVDKKNLKFLDLKNDGNFNYNSCYLFIFRTGDKTPIFIEDNFFVTADKKIGSMEIFTLKPKYPNEEKVILQYNSND